MMNQFVQKIIELTDEFDPTPSSEYKKEWTEGEYSWLVRKRILDDEFVEYFVSRVNLAERWKRDSAFLYVDGADGDWKIEVVT
jgi:hypothetical protein